MLFLPELDAKTGGFMREAFNEEWATLPCVPANLTGTGRAALHDIMETAGASRAVSSELEPCDAYDPVGPNCHHSIRRVDSID